MADLFHHSQLNGRGLALLRVPFHSTRETKVARFAHATAAAADGGGGVIVWFLFVFVFHFHFFTGSSRRLDDAVLDFRAINVSKPVDFCIVFNVLLTTPSFIVLSPLPQEHHSCRLLL